MKKLLIAFGILVVIVIIAVIAIPFFIDANKYKPMVEEQAQKALGRKFTLGQIDLSVWHGGLVIHDISISEDPAFGKKPFVEAKSLSVGVELWPYITSREIKVKSVVLDEPQIRLASNSAGKWNYSSLGKGAAEPSKSASEGNAGAISVQNLSVSNGKITVVSGGREHAYDDVTIDVNGFDFTSRFPFKVSAKSPGGGSLKVDGHAGPLNQAALASSPMDANVTIKDFDLAQTGFMAPGSTVAGKLDYDGNVKSDGKNLTSDGKVKINKMHISAAGAPASVPVEMDYATNLDLATQSGAVTKGLIHMGKSEAKFTGTFATKGENVVLDTKLVANSINIDDVVGLLPAFGVTLPSGATVSGGTASADLTIKGPLGAAVISGPLHVADSKISNFDLKSRAKTMASLAGMNIGKDIQLKTVSTQFNFSPEGIKTDAINVVSPGLGTVTGAGTIGNSGNLNYKLHAKLEGGGGAAGTMVGITNLGTKGGEIPFSITGTTANPIFVPDVGGMLKDSILAPGEKAKGLTDTLGGFFGKKKK